MSYCTHCGTQVAPGTAVCPQCGNPAGGVRQPERKGSRIGIIILIVVVAGGIFVASILGIIAALLVPNFLDALTKAKQKRTVSDLRYVSMALVSYMTDSDPMVLPLGKSLQDLSSALAPKYLASVPTVDGWKHPYKYVCWQEKADSPGCEHFRIASPGRDGIFEHEDLRDYREGTFETTDYDRDIVVGDGIFLRYPASRSPPSSP